MIAFMRGACGAVSTIPVPSAREHLIEQRGVLAIPIANQELE
jgi:hypothetical protein